MEAQDIKTLSEEANSSLDKVQSLLSEGRFARKRFKTETVDAFVGLLNEAADGNTRAEYALKEAMVVADFPYLMADVLDRSLQAQWATTMPAWRNYTKVGTVRDFRDVKLLGIEGMGAVLDAVGERAEYPSVVRRGDADHQARQQVRCQVRLSWNPSSTMISTR